MNSAYDIPLSGRKIGIFGKGGSGKSTCTVLMANALRKRGYQVCVLDADSTNIGMSQALGVDTPPQNLIDYFGGVVFRGGAVTCPVDDPTRLKGAVIDLKRLDARYLRRNEVGIVLLAAGKMGRHGPGEGCDGPLSKIARDIEIDDADESPPVVLEDFKAGFEDSARGVITGLDWAVVVLDPTTASIQMAVNMKRVVRQIKAGELPATAHLDRPELVEAAHQRYTEARIKGVLFVLNKISDEASERYLREALAREGISPLGVIREDRSISAAWLRGEPLDMDSQNEMGQLIIMGIEAAERACKLSS